MRKLLSAIALTALLSAFACTSPASAALSDEAGWGCQATGSKAGWTLLATPQAGWPVSPLVKESPGVIVSWGARVGSGLGPLAQQLGVFEAGSGGGEYRKVAESATETLTEGTNEFRTRIPVREGELLGLYGPSETLVCEGGGVETSALFEGAVAAGETRAFKDVNGVRPPVRATVESDVDGDGYGDASQDRCPESALFQTSCPLVALTIGQVAVKRGAVLIEVGNNTEASVEARGEVGWSAAPKAGGGTAHLSQGRPVKVGLHTKSPKTVMPGATVVLRVPLPSAVQRQLDRRLPRQALRARIDVIGTNLVPYTGTHELKIRLPGRAKPDQPR